MGTIHQKSNFANIQNAFVMLHDWTKRFCEAQDETNKTVFNMGFYITEPLETAINVDWYKNTGVKIDPLLCDVQNMIQTKSFRSATYSAKVIELEDGIGLSILAHEIDLWRTFESIHFYFAGILKRLANHHQVSAAWIHYSVTRLHLPIEHSDAQTEFYKNVNLCGICEVSQVADSGQICNRCVDAAQTKKYF